MNWKRIETRDLEGCWGSRSIRRRELEEWARRYEPPTDRDPSRLWHIAAIEPCWDVGFTPAMDGIA